MFYSITITSISNREAIDENKLHQFQIISVHVLGTVVSSSVINCIETSIKTTIKAISLVNNN